MKAFITVVVLAIMAVLAPLALPQHVPYLAAQAQAAGYDNAADFQEQEQPPQEHHNGPPYPPDNKPETVCHPNKGNDGKPACTCLHQNPEGCRQGKRVQETAMCNSYCQMDHCGCCHS